MLTYLNKPDTMYKRGLEESKQIAARIDFSWIGKKASPLLGFLPVLFGDKFKSVWEKMPQKEKNDLYAYSVEMQVSREMQTVLAEVSFHVLTVFFSR